jgi:glucose-1-phosphate thymidylyltransferase
MSIERIGLIPAAGEAKRLGPLPCSKEVLPIGLDLENRPKVACRYLLEKMAAAGIGRAILVLRVGKWDIPRYFADDHSLGMHLAYVMMRLPFGVPYSIDQAYPFVRDATVCFGFPDILYKSDDAFVRLVAYHEQAEADVTLGLFPAEQPCEVDMVEVSPDGTVSAILEQPVHTTLDYTWANAVWSPTFTEFMHDHLRRECASAAAQPEVSIGSIVQSAIRKHLTIRALRISAEPCLDIGTPANLAKALKTYG